LESFGRRELIKIASLAKSSTHQIAMWWTTPREVQKNKQAFFLSSQLKCENLCAMTPKQLLNLSDVGSSVAEFDIDVIPNGTYHFPRAIEGGDLS
jgi:hypothetical protein